jgi:hypothetical protein
MRQRTSSQIWQQLKPIVQGKTLINEVINDIRPGAVAVRVRSHLTGRWRVIPYRWLRKPNYQGTHGCIVRALQQILGM